MATVLSFKVGVLGKLVSMGAISFLETSADAEACQDVACVQGCQHGTMQRGSLQAPCAQVDIAWGPGASCPASVPTWTRLRSKAGLLNPAAQPGLPTKDSTLGRPVMLPSQADLLLTEGWAFVQSPKSRISGPECSTTADMQTQTRHWP